MWLERPEQGREEWQGRGWGHGGGPGGRERRGTLLSGAGWPEHWAPRFDLDDSRASLETQWIRICLPMQETGLWSLIWEDPTGHGASKSTRHNYWGCALGPGSHNYWVHGPPLVKPVHTRAHAPQQEKPTQQPESSPHLLHLQRSPCSKEAQHSQKQIHKWN